MKNKLLICAVVIMVLSSSFTAFAAEKAVPSNQPVGLGISAMGDYMPMTSGCIYNINGNNYMQLRDICKLLDLKLEWNAENANDINIYTNVRYEGNRASTGEYATQTKTAEPTSINLYVDGNPVNMNGLKVFNIDGSNYFQIRDIAKAINLGCVYEAKDNVVVLNPYREYGENNTYGDVRTVIYENEKPLIKVESLDLSRVPDNIPIGETLTLTDVGYYPVMATPTYTLLVENSNPDVLYTEASLGIAKKIGTTTLTYKCDGITATKVINIVPTSDIIITEEEALNKILALQSQYPEGMTWTNDNEYNNSYGCAAFVAIVEDTVFPGLPSREVDKFEDLRPGDSIRIGDYHSVTVLENYGDRIKVAEGNFNSSIHWGRIITKASLEKEGYRAYTKYPS